MKKTTKNKKTFLLQRQQWLIISLLVVVLFAFGCLVYVADVIWSVDKSL